MNECLTEVSVVDFRDLMERTVFALPLVSDKETGAARSVDRLEGMGNYVDDLIDDFRDCEEVLGVEEEFDLDDSEYDDWLNRPFEPEDDDD